MTKQINSFNYDEFIELDDIYDLSLNDCPICGSDKNQMCSISDPKREGFGIELTNFVHKERVGE